jgi:hypothetical protein
MYTHCRLGRQSKIPGRVPWTNNVRRLSCEVSGEVCACEQQCTQRAMVGTFLTHKQRKKGRKMAGPAPFGGDPLGYGPHWLGYNGVGGTSTGAAVDLGQQNDLGIDNPGDEGATIVTIQYGSYNATFAALNAGGNPPDSDPSDPSRGGVGVFGQSVAGGIDETTVTLPLPDPPPPLTGGIGVAGHCNTGCGVYGQSIFGAGVAGFSTAAFGWGAANPLLGRTFQRAGVLGLSDFGPGVRGHGRSGLPPDPPADPGGVFSSGFLTEANVGAPGTQSVSMTNSPQLRLLPFDGSSPGAAPKHFPTEGKIGDFFFAFITPTQSNLGPIPTAQLFVCLSNDPITGLPVWSQVSTSPPAVPVPTPGLGGTPMP